MSFSIIIFFALLSYSTPRDVETDYVGYHHDCSDEVYCQYPLECQKTDISQVCKCPNNGIYNQNDHTCGDPVGIGDKCSGNEECTSIPNSVCDQEVCSCEKDFVVASDRLSCLPIKKGLGEKCEENKQCSEGIPGSECIGQTCRCKVDDGLFNLHCIKKDVEDCKNDDECYVRDIDDTHSECYSKCHFKDHETEEKDETGGTSQSRRVKWLVSMLFASLGLCLYYSYKNY